MPLKKRTTIQKPGTTALIDGDIIRYTASAAADGKYYHTGNSPMFKYKKEMNQYIEDMGLTPDDILVGYEPEPVENCLHTVKTMVHSIMEKAGTEQAIIYLSGSDNYREDIDSIAPYKGHRVSYKPHHFQAVADYLIKNFDAVVVEGMEADDAMGIEQYKNFQEGYPVVFDNEKTRDDTTIICTKDKDLDMIPGWHYNWGKELKYWVSQDNADLFFYKQLLMGDSTDNIKGIHGVGEKKAVYLLQDAETNEERYEICLEQYDIAGMDYYDLLETANLIWIQRKEGEHWTPEIMY